MADAFESPVAAALEHLTGRSRDTCSWITGDSATAWLEPDGRIHVLPDTAEAPPGTAAAARFRRAGRAFEVEAADGSLLWVNRKPVTSASLSHGDMIEFGDTGPLSRLRLYDERRRPAPSLGGIAGDTLSYLRSSRRPLPGRAGFALAELARRVFSDTTLLFRAGILVAVVLLAVSVALQYRADRRIEAELASGSRQVAALAAALSEARREAIRPGDLAALSEELRQGLMDAAERLESLEARSEAGRRVLRNAAPSVAFLQGAYGLRDPATGRMLRHVTGDDGLPVLLPDGRSLLSLEGDGPVAEVQFNGTGFLVKGSEVLVTNRHVALPWDEDDRAEDGGLEPVMTRFIAYFPDHPEPVAATLAGVSEDADLALLALDAMPQGARGLPIAASAPVPGEEVFVMGYPTGLMTLLAQSGEAFVDELRASGKTGFWEVAEALAAAGRIVPLASRGIVGQAGERAVVYDAETTHGGSGGPVLNAHGEVVAVNAAILPEFGGSNIGVPAARISALLAAARQ